MEPQAIFGISVLLSLTVWGIIGAQYIGPALRSRPRADALRPLLLLHAFRFVGLAFLVPGVVSPELPDGFARPAAYGDLATSILALLAIAALGSRLGTILVWVFNIVGTVDLLNAFYQGNRLGSWSSSSAIRLSPSLIRACGFPALGSSSGCPEAGHQGSERVSDPRPGQREAGFQGRETPPTSDSAGFGV